MAPRVARCTTSPAQARGGIAPLQAIRVDREVERIEAAVADEPLEPLRRLHAREPEPL